MSFKVCSLFLAVLASSVLMSLSCAPAVDVEATKAEVEEFMNRFIEAARATDMESLEASFSDDPDMVLIGPGAGDRLAGWEAYEERLRALFDDESFNYVELTMSDLVVHVSNSGDVAWFSSTIDEEFEFQGETIRFTQNRFTGAVEKRDGNWVIVQIHVSLPTPGEIDPAELRQIIEGENLRHIEYVYQGDPAAVASQYAEDAIRCLGGITRGRAAVEAFWSAIMPLEIIEFSLITEDLSARGNMVYETGSYAVEVLPEGGQLIRDAGEYIVVWERQADGSWLIRVDVAVSSMPAQQ